MSGGTRKKWLWLAAASLIASVVVAGRAQTSVPPEVGCNLERIRDWSRSETFVDLVKQSRGFYKAGTGLAQPASVDSSGWPTEDFDTILMTDMDGVQGLSGVYKVSGVSALPPSIFAITGDVTISNLTHHPLTFKFTADLTLGPNPAGLILGFRATGGGIRDLKIIRPGYPTTGTPTFTSRFLNHIARFSRLRSMEWTQTNEHPVSTWANRTQINSPSYWVEGGVPWEVCVDVANTTNKDLWINVPHQADDLYISSLASLINTRLSPTLHVYVEHSNEVWNPLFLQHASNEEAALAAPPSLGLAYDGTTSPVILSARYHAWRTKHIADIFASVFGPGSLNNRVRVVLAGQQTEPALIYSGLEYLENFYGPPRNYIAALATAPYFAMGSQQHVDGLTSNQVFSALRQSVDNLNADMLLEKNARMAHWFKIPMIAYEGGSDTAGDSSLESKRLALMDPRMYDACVDYLNTWFSWGFGEFQWFTGGATSWRAPSGGWGLTEDMSVQNTYRILAIDTVRAQSAVAVTRGFAVPGIVDARQQVDRPANWATISESLDDLALGQECDYILNAPYAGSFRVRFGMGAFAAGHTLAVSVNGVSVGSVNVPLTGGLHVYAPSSTLIVPLTAGLNVLRVRAVVQGQYSILSVQVLCPLDLDDDGNVSNGLRPDGGVDVNDLLAFVNLFEAGDQRGDVDEDGFLPPVPDGGVDVNDLLFFLLRFEAGC